MTVAGPWFTDILQYPAAGDGPYFLSSSLGSAPCDTGAPAETKGPGLSPCLTL